MTIGAALVRRRVTVLLAVLACAAVFSWGLNYLSVGFKVDGFFRSSDPELQQAMQHYGDSGVDSYEPPDRLVLFAWPEEDPVAFGCRPLDERVVECCPNPGPGSCWCSHGRARSHLFLQKSCPAGALASASHS